MYTSNSHRQCITISTLLQNAKDTTSRFDKASTYVTKIAEEQKNRQLFLTQSKKKTHRNFSKNFDTEESYN